MRNLKNLLFVTTLIACIIGTTASLHAQTDYIITNEGTKIMGEVKTHNVDKVKFKAAGEEKTKKYKPKELKEAYKAGHGVFRSVLMPKNKAHLFCRCWKMAR